MGENRAYPLWLYPRIHVHARDQFGLCRTSSDWMITKPHGHPSAISWFQQNMHHKPLSVKCPSPLSDDQAPVLSLLSSWFIFGCLMFFVITPSHTALLIWFHLFIKAVYPTRSFIPWLIPWHQLIHSSHGPTCLCSLLIHLFTWPTLIPICSQIILTLFISLCFLIISFLGRCSTDGWTIG